MPELLKDLKRHNLTANKTTVYRQLEALITLGIVRSVHLSERAIRYELVHADDHHHHLVCTKCGKIQDIEFDEDIEKYERAIQKKKKFKVAWHALEFYGLCHDCQKKLKKR